MDNVSCMKTLTMITLVLKKSGLWPEKTFTKTTVIQSVLVLLLHVTIYAILVLDIIGAIKSKNIKFTNWLVAVLLPVTHYYAKALTLAFNRSCFFSIIDDLKSDTFNLHSETLNRHIKLIYNISTLIVKCLIVTMTPFVLMFGFLPIITNGLMMIPPPFATEKIHISYKIMQLFFTVYIACNVGAFDVLYLTLIGLCVAQLNILHERLMYILDEANNVPYKSWKDLKDFDKKVDDNIRACVVLHEKINRFVKKLGIILSMPISLQYISGCLMICSSVVQLTVGDVEDTTTLIGLCGYTGTVFVQMYFYHYLGNEIIFKSNQIIESCYLSNWYELDLRYQKRLVFLMERSKKPLIIILYKFIFISLDSLLVIIQWSYSLFALIKAKY